METKHVLTSDGELYHYGVLGMKWGIRRSRKFAEKAKKAKTKEDAKKYQAKSDKIAAYHERMAGGKNVVNRVNKTSTGKAVVQSLVFGTYGALKYNDARSKGQTRGRAAIDGVLFGLGDRATMGVLSIVEPRLGEERKRKIANTKIVNTAKNYINS